MALICSCWLFIIWIELIEAAVLKIILENLIIFIYFRYDYVAIDLWY